jgi:hypothetical protein
MHPDAALLALGQDFWRAWDHAIRFDETPIKAALPIAHAANARVMCIAAAITAAPAITAVGLALKACVADALDDCMTNWN